MSPVEVYKRRYDPICLLSRDEHVLFHRMLTWKIRSLKAAEGKYGLTNNRLAQAVEVTKLQEKIERGLAGDLQIEPDAAQRLRVLLESEE